MRAFYLHGFASSPASAKASFYRQRLGERGVAVAAPDFNVPDFQSLTVTRMLGQLDAAIDVLPAEPIVLIGSSLGGFVAWHAAARRNVIPNQSRPVSHLILLAPAFDFGSDRRADPIVDEWRRTGSREVFHHAYGRPLSVGFTLYEDARRFDARRAEVHVPVLIFQGTRDTIVPAATMISFAERRPNVRLRLLDDDHQLQAHLPTIWQESAEFLGLDGR